MIAHLTLQPALLLRFLATASVAPPAVSLAANLAGTKTLAGMIDRSAHEAAAQGRLDFTVAVGRVVPILRATDLGSTVVTLQGSIALVDYLVTRCIEGVVHGCDLVEAVSPDVVAASVAAAALLDALAARDPTSVAPARELPEAAWIDVATGRSPWPSRLGTAGPVMT